MTIDICSGKHYKLAEMQQLGCKMCSGKHYKEGAKMSVFSLRLSEKITLLIESEAKKTGRSKNEILRNYIEAGMVKDSSSGGSGSVYDALQILRHDLLADLKRAVPAPAAAPTPTPAPSVVTQKIDISELKNDLIAEIRRTVATAQTVQPQQPALPIQPGPETEKIRIALARSTQHINESNQLLEKFVTIAKEQFAKVDKTCAAVDALTAQPSPAPGITREEFAEFVELVRGEIDASRKFQTATSDFIVQSVSQFRDSFAAVAASVGSDALAPVANQIKSFETRALALVRMVGEDAFLARQYSGETLRGTLEESRFFAVVDDIQKDDLTEMRRKVAQILG